MEATRYTILLFIFTLIFMDTDGKVEIGNLILTIFLREVYEEVIFFWKNFSNTFAEWIPGQFNCMMIFLFWASL